MIFPVIWIPDAELELANITVAHYGQDLAAISRAANAIDARLRRDPDQQGVHNYSDVRTLHVPPLVVDFEVDARDMKVLVLSVWHEDG